MMFMFLHKFVIFIAMTFDRIICDTRMMVKFTMKIEEISLTATNVSPSSEIVKINNCNDAIVHLGFAINLIALWFVKDCNYFNFFSLVRRKCIANQVHAMLFFYNLNSCIGTMSHFSFFIIIRSNWALWRQK